MVRRRGRRRTEVEPRKCPARRYARTAAYAAAVRPPCSQRGCAGLCGAGATNAQLECLRTSPCAILLDAFARDDTVCGIGAGMRGDGGTPRIDSGSPDSGNPGACEVGDRRCTGDFEASRCKTIAGRPAIVRENCSAGTSVCEDGWCVDPRNGGAGSSCNTELECQTPDRCEGGFCCTPSSEVCAADDQCCGSLSCRETSFGFRACG